VILPPIFAAVFLFCTGSAWVFVFVLIWYTAILIEKMVMSKVRNPHAGALRHFKPKVFRAPAKDKRAKRKQEARNEVDR
jgi:hypothetical protein